MKRSEILGKCWNMPDMQGYPKSGSVKIFRSGLVFGRSVCYNKNNKSQNPFRTRNDLQRSTGRSEYRLVNKNSYITGNNYDVAEW